jgi:hypothetical protein
MSLLRWCACWIVVVRMAGVVLADMGILPPLDGKIQEPYQSAVICYEGSTKQETLILQTNVRGDRSMFGVFFMPLPAKPEVELGSTNLL